MPADITVEKLYELCDIIDSAEKKSECQREYDVILSAVKCEGANEKRLAAQLIARYFNQFGDQLDKSLEAVFELCEDDDVNIRKLVIKELPSLCKGKEGPLVSRIGDILVQLLQTEDHQEQQIVNSSLFALLSAHVKDTLAAIFEHILSVEEELIRNRAVKFLACKLKLLPDDVLTREAEEQVFNESKKVLQDVSGDEFVLFMHILSNLKHLQTVAGRQLLLDIVVDQADLEKPFQPSDPDRIDQLIQCMRQSIPFLSKNVHSSKFFAYVLDHVFPVLNSIPTALPSLSDASGNLPATGKSIKSTDATADADKSLSEPLPNNENPRLEILRLTTDLSHFVAPNDLTDANKKIGLVFNALMEFLPIPPSRTNNANSSATESALVNENSTEEPKIQFSEIECLIWTMHNLCRKFPEFFTKPAPELEEQFKEFRMRLQYLARVIQIYSKKLNAILSGKKKEELKSQENRIKLIGLKTTSNISNALKDFLHSPPNYKATISASWRITSQKPQSTESSKRSSEGLENQQAKTFRKNVEYYQPPSGKFSVKVDTYKEEYGDTGYSRGNMTWRRGGGSMRRPFRRGFRSRY